MNTNTQRRVAKLFGAALALTAALSLPADAQSRRYGWEGWNRGRGTGMFQLDGTFVDQRYGCALVRDHNGTVIPLVSNPGDLRRGDHLVLYGRVATNTSCGTAFRVYNVEKIWTDANHRYALYDRHRDGDYYARDRWDRDRYGYDDRYSDRDGGRYDRGDRSDRGRYDDRNDRDRYERGQYDRDRNDDRGRYGDRRGVSVTGRLDFGGRCTTLTTENGQVYGLAGEVSRYRDGDWVRVIGTTNGRSACGGPEIEVGQINGR